MLSRCGLLCFVLAVSNLSAKPVARVELGYLQTGTRVTFVRSPAGEWGIEISGGAGLRISQSQPAMLEIFRKEDDIHQVAAGYKTVRKSEAGIDALAEIKYDNVLFRVQDHWSLSGAVLAVHRKVDVVGHAAGGFDSAITLQAPPSVGWSDVSYMAPGALYGDATYNGDVSPGGTLNYAAHHFFMREDILPAPLFALSFHNGTSVAILDPSPLSLIHIPSPRD